MPRWCFFLIKISGKKRPSLPRMYTPTTQLKCLTCLRLVSKLPPKYCRFFNFTILCCDTCKTAHFAYHFAVMSCFRRSALCTVCLSLITNVPGQQRKVCRSIMCVLEYTLWWEFPHRSAIQFCGVFFVFVFFTPSLFCLYLFSVM